MKRFSVMLCLLIMLSACSNSSSNGSGSITPAYPAPQSQATAVANPLQLSYPGPQGQGALPGYPAPDSPSKYQVDISSIVPPADAPTPDQGKASISGVLYSKSSSTILAQFLLYITAGTGENKAYVPPILVGPLPEKGDIKVVTDLEGRFEINNLAPGNYFIVVSMPLDYVVALKNATGLEPLMITLEKNQRKPLGVVVVP